MSKDNSVKILFRFYSDILDEESEETLLAEAVDKEYGYYKLESIPFYAPNAAPGDIIWAEYADAVLVYRKTTQASGNSIIHSVILDDEYDIDAIRGVFEELGCLSEKLNDQYFAIMVPGEIDYLPVKSRLDELEKEKVLDYAESCLSDRHQYKNISF